jgi:hypothetical protein
LSAVPAEKEAIVKRVKELFEIVEAEAKVRRKKRPVTPPSNQPNYQSYAATQSTKRRKKARKPGAVEGPVVTLKELAFDHKISAKDLRRMLRKAGINRPGGRWEWPVGGDDANRIQQIIARRKK